MFHQEVPLKGVASLKWIEDICESVRVNYGRRVCYRKKVLLEGGALLCWVFDTRASVKLFFQQPLMHLGPQFAERHSTSMGQ